MAGRTDLGAFEEWLVESSILSAHKAVWHRRWAERFLKEFGSPGPEEWQESLATFKEILAALLPYVWVRDTGVCG